MSESVHKKNNKKPRPQILKSGAFFALKSKNVFRHHRVLYQNNKSSLKKTIVFRQLLHYEPKSQNFLRHPDIFRPHHDCGMCGGIGCSRCS